MNQWLLSDYFAIWMNHAGLYSCVQQSGRPLPEARLVGGTGNDSDLREENKKCHWTREMKDLQITDVMHMKANDMFVVINWVYIID